MRNAMARAGPQVVLLFIMGLAMLALPGCLNVHEYDENSHLHAMQAERNADDANAGMRDAEINANIDDAWRVAKELPPDAEFDRDDPDFVTFREKLRAYALTDIEVEIDVDQARAWTEYEDSKRPPDTPPPSLGE